MEAQTLSQDAYALNDLLDSKKIDSAYIEFTTKCNISCVYCGSQVESYSGQELDLSFFDLILEVFLRTKVSVVYVSGHGETTTVRDWHLYCNKLLDHGMKLDIITNLAKPLSDDEALTFARFRYLQVSCDTVDVELFRYLRRGADIRTILYNMSKIKGKALHHGLKPPRFSWSVVVCDKTVFGLPDLVFFGLANGVDHFTFANFVDYHTDQGPKPIKHICEMDTNELEKLPALFSNIQEIISRVGGQAYFQGPLIDSVQVELKNRTLINDCSMSRVNHPNIYTTEPDASGRAMTRHCVDPWNLVYIRADGGIQLCCLRSIILGYLKEPNSLQQVLNGDLIKDYRLGLLTGNLKDCCRNCSGREWVPLETLHAEIRKLNPLSCQAGTDQRSRFFRQLKETSGKLLVHTANWFRG